MRDQVRRAGPLRSLRQEVKPYDIRTTVISPGAVARELLEHISDPQSQAQTKGFVGQIAIPAARFAHMVAFVISPFRLLPRPMLERRFPPTALSASGPCLAASRPAVKSWWGKESRARPLP